MTPRSSDHFSIFGLVFFVLQSIVRLWSREKFCNFDPKANFNINFNKSNVGYQGQPFKLLKGPLWPTSCVHISLPSSVTWAFTYNFTRALTQTKGKSKTKLKDSFEEGCSAHEGSNLSFTSA